MKEMESQNSCYNRCHPFSKQISKQNIYFRGHREGFFSKYQGNFLETVKLFAKYNPVKNKHLSGIQM